MNLRVVKRRGDDGDVGASGRDGGFSLVEILMTIVLMGTVLIAVMNAALAGIRSSSSSAYRSKVETVLQNAADRVNRAPKACTYPQFLRAAAQAVGWTGNEVTATYRWYVPGDSAAAATPGTWDGDGTTACDGPVPGSIVQLVTINVTSPDGKVTRELEVVKSDI